MIGLWPKHSEGHCMCHIFSGTSRGGGVLQMRSLNVAQIKGGGRPLVARKSVVDLSFQTEIHLHFFEQHYIVSPQFSYFIHSLQKNLITEILSKMEWLLSTPSTQVSSTSKMASVLPQQEQTSVADNFPQLHSCSQERSQTGNPRGSPTLMEHCVEFCESAPEQEMCLEMQPSANSKSLALLQKPRIKCLMHSRGMPYVQHGSN